MASSGLEELDKTEAGDLGFDRGSPSNSPSSFLLNPGVSCVVGVRFFSCGGPRYVEDRLPAFGRPTIVGVPGYVAATGETVKLLIRSTSLPSVSSVSPNVISFDAPRTISAGFYSISGTVSNKAYGQTRVTINFCNGEVGTAHYNIITPPSTQLDNLGAFRYSKQWYTNTSDYFKRGPSVITYDNKKKSQVLDDPRAWVAGLSDEAGSGAYVSAAAKQLIRPNKTEIAMLETFASRTLWGNLQVSSPGQTYGGVKKSLSYYDASLQSRGLYDPSIDHSGTWPKTEADLLSRSYNYPHAVVVHWTLYRLARNYVGYTTNPWTTYLDRAYDTIIGMQNNAGIVNGFAQFGLMEGSYFLMVLLDLSREGTTNSTLAARANDVRSFMKQRADIWNSETYPYASEFPWDNTAQEEVYFWTSYFGYYDKALATIETLMAGMSSDPHWGYSGTGRDLWDMMYSGAAARANDVRSFMKQRADIWNSETYPYASEFPWDNTAQEEVYFWTSYFGYYDKALATIETLMAGMSSDPHWGYSGTGRDLWDMMYSGAAGNGARLERIFHHYKGAQSAYPLVSQFQAYPTDIKMLRAGYGGVLGPLTSIGSDGFGSSGFHTRPDYLAWDPLSGDNGVNIALHVLSTRAVAVNDAALGGWSGFGAVVTQSGTNVNIKPTDSARQRIFIASNAL
nr:hypothetical protein CFP56_28676 [Quercus suber]